MATIQSWKQRNTLSSSLHFSPVVRLSLKKRASTAVITASATMNFSHLSWDGIVEECNSAASLLTVDLEVTRDLQALDPEVKANPRSGGSSGVGSGSGGESSRVASSRGGTSTIGSPISGGSSSIGSNRGGSSRCL